MKKITRKKKIVYLDNASTTAVDEKVLKEMNQYFSKKYGNPGSFHDLGLEAKNDVDDARTRIARIIGCKAEEIIFTSGGTESINMAIKGIAGKKGRGHIITSKIEHHAVLHVCQYLEKKGFDVSYLDVDKHGIINPENVKKAVRDDTFLISIMYANNEIGTIQDIREITKIARESGILVHSDACQATGYLDININNLGLDMMTLNGSKIYGPKGIGVLVKKKSVEIEPLIHGGGQENDLRSGTENVPGIIGFAKALELVVENRDKEAKRLTILRDYLISELLKIKKTRLNGHDEKRLPNNVNISFMDIEGEAILLYLNEKGICASTGSACASKSLDPSHVLIATGLPYEASHGSIRFTLGKDTTKNDLNYLIKVIPNIVNVLRKISPLNLSMKHFSEKEVEEKWKKKR